MNEPSSPSTSPIPAATLEAAFPRLTDAQIARIEAVGRHREVHQGDVLMEPGDTVNFYLVIRGRLEIIRATGPTEELVAVVEPGAFTGQASMIEGRPGIVRLRAPVAAEVIELERGALLSLLQTDTELGEILLRAFLLRRGELVARGIGDTILVGAPESAVTLRIQEFMTRNAHPFQYVDPERDSSVQELLARVGVGAAELPVVICRGEVVLRNPSVREIADCLGFNDSVDPTQVRDLIVVGAGPAGLAAAVYAASEGLDVLVVEQYAPGGQAGASSWIENYLGFPAGISGQELAANAHVQAQKFGAQFLVARTARRLGRERPYVVELDDATLISAHSLVIATGAQYLKPPVPGLTRFEGVGVHYGATSLEARLCVGEEVIVLGGGNSAGQAAVFLSRTAGQVHLIVRSVGLEDSMSQYLIRRIESHPTIDLRTNTELVALEGIDHLERVAWRDNRVGSVETHEIRHVFVMTGAIPDTGWLEGRVALDARGFVQTGPDLGPVDLTTERWPLDRPPYLLETNLPGVLAVGDVRAGNVKRMASAVGEGAIAVSFVHRVLDESLPRAGQMAASPPSASR